MLRFLHTADLHLDRPFQGLIGVPEPILMRIKNSTFKALEKMIAIAIQEKVDFMVIAGDIYDGETRSLFAQTRLRKQLNRLEEYNIEVYIIHGNHDHLSGDWARLQWGSHVHFFNDKVEMKPFWKNDEVMAHIYGFSYPKRRVTNNMTPFYKKEKGAPYHIGLLHGFYQEGTGHDTYAPFSLEELLEKEFDYWALGHIHKRQALHHDPAVWYPGTPQGLSIKETGDKGCLLVTLDGHNQEVSFTSTADILWIEEAVSINNQIDLNHFIEKIEQLKEALREDTCGVLLRVVVMGSGPLHDTLHDDVQLSDLLSTLHSTEEEKHNFVWIVDIKVKTKPKWNRNELKENTHFISDLIRLIDEQSQVNDLLNGLYTHRRAKRYLDELTEEELTDILSEAESLLIESLMGEGDSIED